MIDLDKVPKRNVFYLNKNWLFLYPLSLWHRSFFITMPPLASLCYLLMVCVVKLLQADVNQSYSTFYFP